MRLPKIALVKSEYYSDLYTDTTTKDWRKIIFSSRMRPGPVALFDYFDTNFFIIKQDSYATNLWTQKITDCKHVTEEALIAMSQQQKTLVNGSAASQHELALSANDIDWSTYDIVIALDACISKSITSKFPTTLWAYYISEGCMSEAMLSRARPYDGYSIFLNQRFRHESDIIDDPSKPHEIDFPYHLMDFATMNRLLGISANHEREGVFIDKDTRPFIAETHNKILSSFGKVSMAGGKLEVVLRAIASSKYTLRMGNRAVWGNASIESVACGTLLISSRIGYRNRIFGSQASNLPGVEFSEDQFVAAIEKINILESNNSYFEIALNTEREMCSRICCQGPINQLLASLECMKNQ